jgi:hypothetical protein
VYSPRLFIFGTAFLTCAALAGVANAAPAARCESSASVLESAIDDSQLPTSNAQLPKLNAFVGSEQALRGTTRALERHPVEHPDDRYALDEMLLGSRATPLRWDRAPELVVLMPVMQYEKGRGAEYRATSERLSDQEATQLVADLTSALGVLTDNTFQGFSSVRRESAAAGDVVNVMRPGQIVVARYNGVRDQLATIGFGGRSTRDSTIRAGSIILDNDFDRANETRRLLRMHELGHALGYNHVLSRPSIMNPQIGSELTTFDRTAARIAFQGFRPDASSCS